MPSAALAHLIAWPGRSEERSVPIFDHLFVGRECSGIDDEHRFLIDDGSVSRTHVELHLDPDHDHAWLTDRSTNGTRLNGARMERSVPVQIMPGDRVQVGPVEFQFFSPHFTARADVDSRQTVRRVDMGELVMAVGDIVSFSTISEYTDGAVLLQSINDLYSRSPQAPEPSFWDAQQLRRRRLFRHVGGKSRSGSRGCCSGRLRSRCCGPGEGNGARVAITGSRRAAGPDGVRGRARPGSSEHDGRRDSYCPGRCHQCHLPALRAGVQVRMARCCRH